MGWWGYSSGYSSRSSFKSWQANVVFYIIVIIAFITGFFMQVIYSECLGTLIIFGGFIVAALIASVVDKACMPVQPVGGYGYSTSPSFGNPTRFSSTTQPYSSGLNPYSSGSPPYSSSPSPPSYSQQLPRTPYYNSNPPPYPVNRQTTAAAEAALGPTVQDREYTTNPQAKPSYTPRVDGVEDGKETLGLTSSFQLKPDEKPQKEPEGTSGQKEKPQRKPVLTSDEDYGTSCPKCGAEMEFVISEGYWKCGSCGKKRWS